MGEVTDVEWADHTFGWRGCSEAKDEDGNDHPGCNECYAREGYGKRFDVKWGPPFLGGTREMPAEKSWSKVRSWAGKAAELGEMHRVFMSLGDPLESIHVPESLDAPEWPEEWTHQQRALMLEHAKRVRAEMDSVRAKLWDVIRATAKVCGKCHRSISNPGAAERVGWKACRHASSGGCSGAKVGGIIWLVLTKRPENWQFVPRDVRPLTWLGTSVSDQRTADIWIPRLLDAQEFGMLFLSMEPLVGPVSIRKWMPGAHLRQELEALNAKLDREYWAFTRQARAKPAGSPAEYRRKAHMERILRRQGIGWAIIGGESGLRARSFHVDWARVIIEEIRTSQREEQELAPAAFLKQLGPAPLMDYRDWARWVGEVGWTNQPLVTHEGKAWDVATAGQPPEGAIAQVPLKSRKGGKMEEWPRELHVREWPQPRVRRAAA